LGRVVTKIVSLGVGDSRYPMDQGENSWGALELTQPKHWFFGDYTIKGSSKLPGALVFKATDFQNVKSEVPCSVYGTVKRHRNFACVVTTYVYGMVFEQVLTLVTV
jgi:hypothetical protein